MADDYESMPLVEIIRLQEQLSALLQRKFSRELALVFTDVVGSSAYFARYGDEAGRMLQQRHIDLLERAIAPHSGRIVDTAGDGAFSCFPRAEPAKKALCELLELASEQNAAKTREHQLVLRCGLHTGRVLSDGVIVSGDAVNICARVAATADLGEIRLTGEAVRALPLESRAICSVIGPMHLKGIPTPVEVRVLAWRNPALFPAIVRISETNMTYELPDLDLIAFGRRVTTADEIGNHVVLTLPDEHAAMQISRFQFELRRRPHGFVLCPVSAGKTVVDGNEVAMGTETPIRPGSVVKLSGVMTLTFQALPLVKDPLATIHRF